jgi:regulator of sigma E protease
MVVLKFIFIILEVLLVFNLLIFVHELGHFLAARWRGLKIERFAIWFGKPIWKTKINGVEYALGSIPAGGYVSLPQMATMEVIEGKTDSSGETLPPISALDKIIVAFAGPLFSFGLAMAFALIVWAVGRPVSEAEMTTIIGYVEKDGPAEKAGLKPGDRILAVDGKAVKKFYGMGESIQWRVIRSEDKQIPVKFERDGKLMETMVEPIKEPTKAWQRQSLRQILIQPAQAAIIGKVFTNGPAARAGLKVGDEIVEVNGVKVVHGATIANFIEQHGTQKLELKVMRGDQRLTVSLTPEIPMKPQDEKPRLGILWAEGGKMRLAYPGPIEQVVASVSAMISTFDALFSKKSDIKPQHLGGFVKIITVYYVLFQSEEGWRLVLWFSVLMNVNLALLNLVPVPVLDGGHILLAVVEAARRKPVSARLLNYIQTSCAVLLIGYMLYIMFYDVQEVPWWRRNKPEGPEMIFAPQTPQR